MAEHILLMIYPILLMVLTFFGAKRSKKGELASDFMKPAQTKLIQGAACMAVVIHHLTQHISKYGYTNKGPIGIFNYIGILFTAIFFFVSGYGLITSVYNKEGYLDTFLTKRLPTVLIPFCLINVMGVLLLAVGLGVRYTVSEALSDIFGFTLINSNGWFIIEIVIIYIIFFAAFTLFKNKDVALLVVSVAVLLLIIYSYNQGHDANGVKASWFKGEWWFNSTITFIFGMVFARFKDAISGFCNRHYRIILVITAILFVLTVAASIYTVIRYGYYIEGYVGPVKYGKLLTLISQMAACIVSTMLVILLNMRITLGNKALSFISKISVELFLIHGYFLEKIFGSVRMGDMTRFAVVIISSVAFTAAVSPIIRWIVNKVTALLSRKKIYNDTLEGAIAKKNREKMVKTWKLLGSVAALLGCIVFFSLTIGKRLIYMIQFSTETDAIADAKVGDVVKWGHFDTDRRPGRERLEWIVIKKDGNEICLVTKQGIDGYWYNQKHEAVSWENSDIRQLLNSDEYYDMFSNFEMDAIIEKNGDLVSLLTTDEAMEAFKDDADRELDITDEAELKGTNINTLSKVDKWDMKGYRSSWWWLRRPGNEADVYAPVVTVNGEVAEHEKEVNRTGGAIRPVIWIELEK